MDTVIVLFTRDLRVRDHPALAEACRTAAAVVPLFVIDPEVLAGDHGAPNRVRFLTESLADLRSSLRDRGGDLVLRQGDTVTETMAVAAETGATAVYLSGDVSAFARRRERRLHEACATRRVGCVTFPGVTVVPSHELAPASGDHFKVFTPYWRAWSKASRRSVEAPPRRVPLAPGIEPGRLPEDRTLVEGRRSPSVAPGGESEGLERARAWSRSSLAGYDDRHDDLPGDATSRLSPYLHLGCLSPLELAERLGDRDGGGPFIRQLCWRDFHHQVTAAFPAMATEEYRTQGDRWRHDAEELEAWKRGTTGYPIVDAGMRQLAEEGWMHNRARLLVASFLTKDLYLDWRLGARHFFDLLVDGDIANNAGNWQWVAGTGNDTRPHRVFNPVRQARRFDPDGEYVRRYVPELADVAGAAVHEPWKLDHDQRKRLDYPAPIVDHDEAVARFRQRRPHSGGNGKA